MIGIIFLQAVCLAMKFNIYQSPNFPFNLLIIKCGGKYRITYILIHICPTQVMQLLYILHAYEM